MTKVSKGPIQRGRIENRITGEEARRLDEVFLPFLRDSKFINANRSVLREKYPDRYVAVQNEKVVGYNKNRKQLYYKLRKRGIDPRECVIELMETRRRTLILAKVA